MLGKHDDLLRNTLQAGPVALRGLANATGTGNAVDLNVDQRAAGRLLDVRDQRAGEAVRDDPVLQGLQMMSARTQGGRARRGHGLVAAVVVVAASAGPS